MGAAFGRRHGIAVGIDVSRQRRRKPAAPQSTAQFDIAVTAFILALDLASENVFRNRRFVAWQAFAE